MNEFEWLRQTRALRHEQHPARDLWPGIAAALEPRSRRAHAWLPTMATAAVVLLSITLGIMSLNAPRSLMHQANLVQAPRWKPADPRLAGAAVEFQAADSEIRLALQQSPDAAYLQRIRQRTMAQQWRLQRYARQAP